MPKSVYLIGMMGSGKTTTARELSLLVQKPVIDLDTELEKKTGKTISEVFQEKGGPWFRMLETSLLVSFNAEMNAVFSTGGGVVLSRQNRDWMRSCGTVVFLNTSLEFLWSRVSREKGKRPLLEDGEAKQRLMSIMAARQPLYEECAHVRVITDGKSPREIAREIQGHLKLES